MGSLKTSVRTSVFDDQCHPLKPRVLPSAKLWLIHPARLGSETRAFNTKGQADAWARRVEGAKQGSKHAPDPARERAGALLAQASITKIKQGHGPLTRLTKAEQDALAVFLAQQSLASGGRRIKHFGLALEHILHMPLRFDRRKFLNLINSVVQALELQPGLMEDTATALATAAKIIGHAIQAPKRIDFSNEADRFSYIRGDRRWGSPVPQLESRAGFNLPFCTMCHRPALKQKNRCREHLPLNNKSGGGSADYQKIRRAMARMEGEQGRSRSRWEEIFWARRRHMGNDDDFHRRARICHDLFLYNNGPPFHFYWVDLLEALGDPHKLGRALHFHFPRATAWLQLGESVDLQNREDMSTLLTALGWGTYCRQPRYEGRLDDQEDPWQLFTFVLSLARLERLQMILEPLPRGGQRKRCGGPRLRLGQAAARAGLRARAQHLLAELRKEQGADDAQIIATLQRRLKIDRTTAWRWARKTKWKGSSPKQAAPLPQGGRRAAG
ncbi:MAG: hypothetical protein ACYCS1_09230 [Gammaproteobacteria bacterium]